MTTLVWLSVAALIVLLSLFLYWSWREEKASARLIQGTFYGGMGLFAALFAVFTWNTLAAIPQRTHSEALTAEVIAGKEAWQKYSCIDCHTILGNGAYYAPELTKAWDRFLERAGGNPMAARTALVAFLQNPPQATAERRGMTNFHMPPREAQQLAAFLEWTSKIDTNGWPPAPLHPVSRSDPPQPRPVSSVNSQGERAISDLGCTGCHSVGGGRVVGPDLKQAGAKYDSVALASFIRNPDAVYRARGKRPLNKGYSEMPTLAVSEQDAQAIAAYLISVGEKEQQ